LFVVGLAAMKLVKFIEPNKCGKIKVFGAWVSSAVSPNKKDHNTAIAIAKAKMDAPLREAWGKGVSTFL